MSGIKLDLAGLVSGYSSYVDRCQIEDVSDLDLLVFSPRSAFFSYLQLIPHCHACCVMLQRDVDLIGRVPAVNTCKRRRREGCRYARYDRTFL
jgi:predicted nucleotidyltransferase